MWSSRDYLQGVDLHNLARKADPTAYLADIEQQVEARIAAYTPMTVEDRLGVFREIGFHPHGLYLPSDVGLFAEVRAKLRELGRIENADARNAAYQAFQAETERWQLQGVPGHWNGQQAVARSRATFRVVVFGRRGGKTMEASREGYAVLKARTRSTVWVVAPTMRLVGRVFDMLVQLVRDLKTPIDTLRNGRDEKLLILGNGSRCEGVSVDNVLSAAGAAVDLAIVDEAAQIGYDAIARAILPPLTDRGGQGLFISSWEGEDGYFAALADMAKRFAEDGDPDWEFFEDASYEVNFYSFAQGRSSPALQRQEAVMDPIDFLEQYGAVRAGARHLIYPQFKKEVHVGDYPFNPNHPVHLAVDPSSGANEYAVIALQDYGDTIHVVDELYIPGIVAEDVFPILAKKEWIDNFVEGVMDSASPAEIERWVRAGFNMIGVPDKPQPEERFPIYRNLLRDPAVFHFFYVRIVQEVLIEWGMDPDAYLHLDPHLERRVQIEVEERLGRPSPEDVKELRACAHIFFNESTTFFTAEEHRHYVYRRPPKANLNTLEKPRKWKDHAMDALGYYAWTYKRWDWDVPGDDYTIVQQAESYQRMTRLLDESEEKRSPHARAASFLRQLRDEARYGSGADPSRSFVPSWWGD